MRLKYILTRPGEEDDEVLVEKSTPEFPIPSVGDRVRVDDEFYRVWEVFHAFDCDAFDDPDETHALVAPLGEAIELIGEASIYNS